MGSYLAQPITEKNLISKESPSHAMKFTLCEMQGWRRQMEDAAICQIDLGDGNSLFAVFDGHGGPEVSSYVKEKFVEILLSTYHYQIQKYDEALFEAFKNMDALITSDEGQQGLRAYSSKRINKTTQKSRDSSRKQKISDCVGCTAHVVLITPKHFIVANSGDSRSVLCRNGKAYGLSIDHKPENEYQSHRIINAGGKIQKGRINSGLNLSRSFGDFSYKKNTNLPAEKQMVICHPDVKVYERSKKDKYLLLGCDGVFEKYSENEEPLIVKINKMMKRGLDSQDIMQKIFDSLIARSTKQILGCDNMTSILVEFK